MTRQLYTFPREYKKSTENMFGISAHDLIDSFQENSVIFMPHFEKQKWISSFFTHLKSYDSDSSRSMVQTTKNLKLKSQ